MLGGSIERVQEQLKAAAASPILVLATPFQHALLPLDEDQSSAQDLVIVVAAPWTQRRVSRALVTLQRRVRLKALMPGSSSGYGSHAKRALTPYSSSGDDTGSDVDRDERPDVSWLRVLVVDDVRVNRLVLSRMLKKLGVAAVDMAENGQVAVDKVRR